MLVINQNTVLIDGELGDKLKKYGNLKVRLNRASIEDDIARVTGGLYVFRKHKLKNINKVKSYENIIEYLRDLRYASSEDSIELEFECESSCIEAFPVFTLKIDELKLGIKLEFADYIEILNPLSTLVRINYSSIMSGIVLELCHEDLGITHDMIEQELIGCGPVMFNDSNRLDCLGLQYKEIEGKKRYADITRLGMELKIDETDYYNAAEKIPLNYYCKECEKDIYYTSSIVSSMRYTMCLIVKHIMDLLDRYKATAKIVAIYEDEILINLDKNKELLNELKEPIALRVYGRRFKFPVTLEEVSL